LIVRNQLVISQKETEKFPHGIFGGNIDLEKLEAILADPVERRQILLVMLTITNNTGGGLPVSLENIRQVREMIDHYFKNEKPLTEGLPPVLFFFDACRFAENAYFIQQYEPGYKDKSIADIAREMFSYVDGCTMSAKKDGLTNIGGFIATRWETLRRRCWEHMVEVEGFYTYGGLAGRDLEAIAVGIKEGVDDRRVRQRVLQVQRLWKNLYEESVPVKTPCGGHGVFILGRKFWKNNGKDLIDPHDLPGHTLAVELYRLYGIRACEIGTVMFGDWDPQTGRATRIAPDEDYVRLAVPRRVYTDTHMDFVASALSELYRSRCSLKVKGMRFIYRPDALPHFLAQFEPLRY
ncbi:MAG: tryptophanase, partial [bacterium]